MTTISNGRYTAVLDRFEDDLAVLLVEDGDEQVGEMGIPADQLPESGQHVDAVFTVLVKDGALADAWYDDEETEARKDDAQSRFDRLSERPPTDDEENR